MRIFTSAEIIGPLSAIAAGLLTWLLSRSKYRAEVTESLALTAKTQAETDAIRLETFGESIAHLEARVLHLERETIALHRVWDYLAERVDPAIAAEARELYHSSITLS